MRIDVNAFLGHYPFRKIEGGSPALLLEAMKRTGIDQAWVSNLPAMFWRDPTEGNAMLYRVAETQPALRPVPAVHPGLANWEAALDEAAARAPAVRVDATFLGINPLGAEMAVVASRAAELGLPIMMAVKLEDGRQRHPHDRIPDLSPAEVRGLLRVDSKVRLIVTHADRDFIEQVHFGSTPAEAARVLWDICWLWGPPMDDIDHLVATIGATRFCFGTGMPLRIPESSVAKLELLRCSPAERAAIEALNANTLAGASR